MFTEHPAVKIVRLYLEASMKPDPVAAAEYVAPDVDIIFTGGRRYNSPSGPTEFNAGRYRWVKKALGQFDWTDHGDHAVVYSNGTLYGEWPDGQPFAGNRYLDRFEVCSGKIVRMDVWNDSAEWILSPQLNRTV